MTLFYLAAAALVVVALALLLRPWRRTGDGGAESLIVLNAAIHRDRLAELEHDNALGTLSDADLAEAREELQRQLLDDTAAGETRAADGSGRRSAIAIVLLLPLLAVALYALLGSPAAVLPVAEQELRAAADMEQRVGKLAKKLEQNPDNPQGWAMLARSYKSLGRWDEAERAFARVGKDLEQNAELLAEFAELLVQKNGGFDQRSRGLVKQALGLDHDNMLALFMAGGDAFERGRHEEAAALWQRLLPQLEPGSEDARLVEDGIARARSRGDGAKPESGSARAKPAKPAGSRP